MYSAPIRLMLLALACVTSLAGCWDGLGPPADPTLFDAFHRGRDVSRYLAEEQLEEISSGNAILGQAGQAILAPKISGSIRVARVTRSVPTLSGATLSESGQQPSVIPTADASATNVHFDVAVPLLRGFEFEGSRILSVAALGHATIASGYGPSDLGVQRGGAFTFGFGARIGIVPETHHLPSVSVSIVRHSLPGLRWAAQRIPTTEGNDVTLAMYDLSGRIVSKRLAASKEFGAFGVTAGIGRDGLVASTSQRATISGPRSRSTEETGRTGTHRTTLFGGGSFAIHKSVSLAAEVGRTSRARDLTPRLNTVGAPVGSRTQLTVGVRVGG